MIKIIRLNGAEAVVNAELIETVESTPDTILTLTTGKKILVRDTVDAVVSKVVDYKRSVFTRLPVTGAEKPQGT